MYTFNVTRCINFVQFVFEEEIVEFFMCLTRVIIACHFLYRRILKLQFLHAQILMYPL